MKFNAFMQKSMRTVLTILFVCIFLFTSVICNSFTYASASTTEEELKNTSEVQSVHVEDKINLDSLNITVNGDFESKRSLDVEKKKYKRLSERNVSKGYTFDIKVINPEGDEMQPKDDVSLSFEFENIPKNINVNVYHEETKLKTKIKDDVVTVKSDGFSLYTVEFTYDDKEYVLDGDDFISLRQLLKKVGIEGTIESWSVSDKTLFDIFMGDNKEPSFEYLSDSEGNEIRKPINEGDTPYLVSLKPFDTDEWLKVIVDRMEYEIAVTDSQVEIDGVTQDINGVTQGQYISDFTSNMQLATIFIDEDIINSTPESRNSAVGKILNGYETRGFGLQNCTNNFTTRQGNVLYFNGGNYKNDDGEVATPFVARKIDGVNHYWIDFPGDVVEYVFKNGAESSKGDKYDVIITYSDLRIALQYDVDPTALSEMNSGDIKFCTFAGNAVLITQECNGTITNSTVNSNQGRYGLKYNVNVKVVENADADTRITIPGTFIYPMVDIDVDRVARANGGTNFVKLYDAANNRNYSEQIQILNNNFGDVFIPYQASETDATKYKAGISETSDGLLFYPRVTGDSDSLLTGFVTLANNAAGGINLKGLSAGSGGAAVETYLLSGGKTGSTVNKINHKIKSSTKTWKVDGTYDDNDLKGGTIETTQKGNQDGTLQDGSTILGPNILTAASGETINYTMTPNVGYKVKKVYVSNRTLDYQDGSEIVPTAVYDDDGVIKYYTFKFERINSDNAIHVEWEPDIKEIKVRKTTVDDKEGVFDYKIEFFTKKYHKAQIHNVSVMAGITTDELNNVVPYYYFFNTRDAFEINGITIPSGSFTNGRTRVGLDAICDILLDQIDQNSISVQVGSEPGTLSTDLTTSINDQIQELIDDDYTSAALDASVFTFSTPTREEELPWSFDGVPVGMIGSNGTYTFKVTNGAEFTIPNVPNGVYYTLTEEYKDGWTCKSNNPIDSRIKNQNANHEFVNEYNSYDITVKKKTVDEKPGVFNFMAKIFKDVEIPAQSMPVSVIASGSGGVVTYKLINNKQEFEVTTGDSTITVPSGEYVYESGDSNLDALIDLLISTDGSHQHSISLNGENGYITTGADQTISDKVQSLIDNGQTMFYLEPVEFEFGSPLRIEKQGYNFETLPEGVSGADGVFIFNLQNNDTKTLPAIPHGYEYEIIEGDKTGWECTKIEESSSATPVLVDFKDLAGITPTMYVNNHAVTTSGGWINGDHFQPQVNGGNTYIRLRYGTDGKTSQFTSSNHTVEYEDEIVLVYPNAVEMPDGSEKDLILTISDISLENPENSMNVNFKGSIFRATGGPAVAIGSHGTNNTQRTPANYTVNEKIKVSIADSAKHEFFKVKYDGVEYERNGYDGISFNVSMSGSSRSFSSKTAEALKTSNTHEGSGSTVIENPDEPSYKNELDSDVTVKFTNEEKKHDLVINKTTVDNKPGQFKFKVKVWKEGDTPSYLNLIQYGGTATSVDGVYEFTLSDGDSITIPDLENGYKWEIVEETPIDWDNIFKTNDTGTMTTESPDTVSSNWINRQVLSDLTIRKTTDVQTDTNFQFRVRVWKESDLTYKYLDLSDVGGTLNDDDSYTFYIKSGNEVTIPNIPRGYKYTISEILTRDDWTLEDSTNDSGTIRDSDIISTFRNESRKVKLKLSKKVKRGFGSLTDSFKFTLSFSRLGANVDYRQGLIADASGNASIVKNLSSDQSVSWDNLPYTAKYSISESNDDIGKLYNSSWIIDAPGENNDLSGTGKSIDQQQFVDGEPSNDVTVFNERNPKAVTRISSNIISWVLLFIVVVVCVLSMVGTRAYLKKNQSDII